jgi:hypothetical protein
MFTISNTSKRDAWSALDNELLAHRLRKRTALIASAIARDLETGLIGQTTRKRK